MAIHDLTQNRNGGVLAVMVSLAAGIVACARQSPTPYLTPLPASSATPQFGDTFVSIADEMTMVFLPAGKFAMGSEIGLTDEQPLHTVFLDAFWIDQTEVTNAMYRRCVQTGDCQVPSDTTYYGDLAFSDHPVAFVSWKDSSAYCSWADRRLPTEAEWEKAASWDPQTNEKRIYPWGNEFDCEKGNFDDETQLDSFVVSGGPNCDGHNLSAPTASFPSGASPYGALDMGGNVWEWVNDAFIERDPFGETQNYYAISPASNPPGVDPAITPYRILRGSSWNYSLGSGRAAYRLWFGLDDAYDGMGLRCARPE